MEVLIFLAVVVCLIIMLSGNSKNGDAIQSMADAILRLSADIRDMKNDIARIRATVSGDVQGNASKDPARNEPEAKTETVVVATPALPLTDEITPPKAEPLVLALPLPVKVAEQDVKIPVMQPQPDLVPQPDMASPAIISAEAKVSEPIENEELGSDDESIDSIRIAAFQDNNVKSDEEKSATMAIKSDDGNIERFIGENLINKIGIAVLVLGIAFFVKYAIDQNWISEAGRVAIGMLCGAILVAIAHVLRTNYRSFSSVLAGGGIAVFYATISFAYHQYSLIPQVPAFVVLVIITIFAVVLSLLYDRLELAVIATIGGFIAPFLVSNGDGNYLVLFTYLLVLNSGLLALAYHKRWPAINVIALFFTVITFGSWLAMATIENKPYVPQYALAFGAAFYGVFLGMNMVYQLKNREVFRPYDFTILLLLSAAFYSAGMTILHSLDQGKYQGFFTLAMGVANLSLAWIVYKRGYADKNLFYMLVGLTLTFVTLTIPIQLHGHAITMFWSAEFVLLYWLSVYSGIRLFRYSSVIICMLSLISLAIDWEKASQSFASILLIFNDAKGVVTNLVSVAAFSVSFVLLRRNKDREFLSGLPSTQAAAAMLTGALLLLFITAIFTVNLIFRLQLKYDVPNVYHFMITYVFAIGLLQMLAKFKHGNTAWYAVIIMVVSFIVFLVGSFNYDALLNGALCGTYSKTHLMAQHVDDLLFASMLYFSIVKIRKTSQQLGESLNNIIVVTGIMCILFLSFTVFRYYAIATFHNNLEEIAARYRRAGLTVVWGICSFSLMAIGMSHRQRTLRLFALTVFTITLLKLFLFDIYDLGAGAKILAFISLGVLLLTVSFMYQKLKAIIFTDTKHEKDK